MEKQLSDIRFLCVRRWTDKMGNVYHSIRLVFADGAQTILPVTYGYGDAFRVTIAEHFKTDYADAARSLPWSMIDCVNVTKKQDLHA